MRCAYCGNSYLTDAPRCEGCGSPRSARMTSEYRDADTLYAEVGHALITGEANKSRALLEKIIGSPKKDPTKLWTERAAKIALVLCILWFFPTLIWVGAVMFIPFIVTIYLPYLGLRALFSWISGDPVQR